MKKRTRWILLTIIVIVVVIVVAGVIAFRKIEENLNRLAALEIGTVDLKRLEDGLYEGQYESFPVKARVRVTVEAHEIVKIDLLEHVNGKGKDAEIIPQRVIESQSLQVDVVSGATYSSKVILKAIEAALITQ
ncbi:MAG: FMN-binding protein [Thermotogaceae bacterium]|nr:FMN-binding protein [Thermotogaceae bacterium]HOZ12361.1 FMN-binding protein [Thermotogota bacterium]HPX97066.1 FMN-binding protein [Thermotogota bacterium]HQC37339.1 FMN-binding protein [Thermotogota bacterium]